MEIIDSDVPSDASTAIVVVRRYLQRWLNKPSNGVVFTTVGPSPFHADFQVEGYSTPNEIDLSFQCETFETRGYAGVTFRCHSGEYSTATEACNALFYELGEELDLFYEIKRKDSDVIRQWDDVQELASDVIERFKTTGWFKFIHTLTRRSKIAELRISLVEFEERHLSYNYALNDAYRKLYESGRVMFLRKFLDDSVKSRLNFPTQQFIDLIEFLERRRSKSIEFLVILIAALIGGAAGAAITSMF